MRFFLEEAAEVGDVVSLSTADSYHLSRVLRKKPGYQLELVSANRVFAAELLSQGSEQEPAQVRLLQELAAYSEAPLRLILLQGLAKGERMEIVLQKAVELGADCSSVGKKLRMRPPSSVGAPNWCRWLQCRVWRMLWPACRLIAG